MNSLPLVDLFAEDHAHEAFLRAVVRRFEREKGKPLHMRIRNARGGHGRVMSELKLFQRSVLKQTMGSDVLPDMLIVAIDANCQRLNAARKGIENAIEKEFRDRTVIACPDPHIEKWYLSDRRSFFRVVGKEPRPIKEKCERGRYKSLLSETILAAGHPSILGGIEFAEDLVNDMHFYRAGKTDRSLQIFIEELERHIDQL